MRVPKHVAADAPVVTPADRAAAAIAEDGPDW